MKIVFATSNENKVNEIKKLLPKNIEIASLKEINYTEEIEETGKTLEENSLLKAQTIYNIYKEPVLAEDTGLEVDALNNEPGVFSARYAGTDCNSENNIDLLLKNLENKENRKAQFRTVATFIEKDALHIYEGVVRGEITNTRKGEKGFGYDAVFIPAGFNKTFAEMTVNEKNIISHRGIAIKKFLQYVNK